MQLGKYAEKVVISDIEVFRAKTRKLKIDGLDKLHLVSDFDWTITKQSNPDKKISSSFGIMKRSSALSEGFLKESDIQRNKYLPYEIAIDIAQEERFSKMEEWWSVFLKLICKERINRNDVSKVIAENKMHFRKYFEEISDFANNNNVPFLIFSAGLGSIIEGFLKKNNLLKENMDIIGNFFDYDNDGFICGYKNDILHIANKSEKFIPKKFKKDIESRKNIILMGDSLMDHKMVEEQNGNVILRIGFLNNNVSEKLSAYKNLYDVVILYDSDMEFVWELLGEMNG